MAVLSQALQPSVTVETRIGAIGGGTPDVFGSVADIAVDASGRIYVLDDRTYEVRVFTRSGEHVTSFGRRGQGPGEFDSPVSIDVAEGVVVVQNSNGLAVRFSTDGRHLTSNRVESGLKSSVWLGGDRFAVLKLGSTSLRRTDPSERLLLWEGTVTDTVASAPSSDLFVQSAGRSLARRTRFCGLLHFARDEAGTLLVGTGTDGRIGRVDWRGEDSRWVRRDQVATEATPLRDEDFAYLLASLPEDYDVAREDLVTSPVRSGMCGLEAGRDGLVWVRMADENDRERWIGHDPDSLNPRQSVLMPVDVSVRAFANGWAVGTESDELGVPYVLVLTLTKGD